MPAVFNLMPVTRGGLFGLRNHLVREGRQSNPDIDPERIGLNREIFRDEAQVRAFSRTRQAVESARGTRPKIRKDAAVAAAMVLHLPKEFGPRDDNPDLPRDQRFALWKAWTVDPANAGLISEWMAVEMRFLRQVVEGRDTLGQPVDWEKASGRIALAQLHLDEFRPHLHVLVRPVDERGWLSYKQHFSRQQAKLRAWQKHHRDTMAAFGGGWGVAVKEGTDEERAARNPDYHRGIGGVERMKAQRAAEEEIRALRTQNEQLQSELSRRPRAAEVAALKQKVEQLESRPTPTEHAALADRLQQANDTIAAKNRVIARLAPVKDAWEKAGRMIRDLGNTTIRTISDLVREWQERGKRIETLDGQVQAAPTAGEIRRLNQEISRLKTRPTRAEMATLRAQLQAARRQLDAQPGEQEISRLKSRPTRAEFRALRQQLDAQPSAAKITRLKSRPTRAEFDALETDLEAARRQLDAQPGEQEISRLKSRPTRAEFDALRGRLDAAPTAGEIRRLNQEISRLEKTRPTRADLEAITTRLDEAVATIAAQDKTIAEQQEELEKSRNRGLTSGFQSGFGPHHRGGEWDR